MNTVHVNVQNEYDVCIGRGLLTNLDNIIREITDAKQMAVITDDNVDFLYGKTVLGTLQKSGFSVCKYVFPAGEKSKNLHTLENILDFLSEKDMKRDSIILALGGGVVGDLSGFAASVYMRGISYIQIPTTLLSMIDSSVGGKTAVNLEKGKNLAGSFWQPIQVICDLDTLQTLPQSVFAEGMGEVIKTNWIAGLDYHQILADGKLQGGAILTEGQAKERIEEIVAACVEYKSKIVSADEFDRKGIRAILNAGHTIGHCIEKVSGYSIAHGKAVAMGLLWESAISCELGICDIELFNAIKQEVVAYGLWGEVPFEKTNWIRIMSGDKKNNNLEITFELARTKGDFVEKKIPIEMISQLLETVYCKYLK